MRATAELVTEAALDLDPQERARLVDQLVRSIAEDWVDFSGWFGRAQHQWEMLDIGELEVPPEERTPIMDAHMREAQRRAEQIDRGEVTLVDMREAMDRVHKRLGL